MCLERKEGVGVYMLPWMFEMAVERGAGYEGVFVEVRVGSSHGLGTVGAGKGA